MRTVISDVACTLCGCVCDDLAVETAGDTVVQIERACPRAEDWFRQLGKDAPPVARVAGVEVPLEAALARAAALLGEARYPLIYGLSRSSTPGQRAAVRLADQLGAVIDTTASRCHAPSIMALQEIGESTCSLGESRHRADVFVYWGSNPVVSHPRHLERYGSDATSSFLSDAPAARQLIVIDTQATETTARADLFVRVAPQRDFELIWALRCLLHNLPLAEAPECGVPAEEIRALAERLRNCRTGVVFFGLGLTRSPTGHRTVEALLRLVTDLNQHCRFYARRMRVYGDVAGADSVLCWQTGYPFSVDLARGYPRYNPGEYSANDVLRRGEVDACLLVGSEGLAPLDPEALAHLREIPVVALDYPGVPTLRPGDVQFTTAIYGVHAAGTAYRMDEIPVPLRAFLPSPYPTDHAILDELGRRVSRRVPR